MKVLATYSIKGGVGKTSAAVNLASIAAERGWRVLLWDLDPQGGATYLLRVRARVKGGGRSLVSLDRELADVVRGTDVPNLDLVPADFRYRHLDLLLDDTKRPTRQLRKVVRPVRADYDWVVLDCAPSVSLVSEGVLEAAHGLLVPVVPSMLSARTLDQLVDFIDESAPKRRPQVLAFLSMLDRRKTLHRQIADELPASRPGLFLDTAIPTASAVEQMGSERLPLHHFAPRHRAAAAYDALWDEIEARWPEP